MTMMMIVLFMVMCWILQAGERCSKSSEEKTAAQECESAATSFDGNYCCCCYRLSCWLYD